LGQRINFDREAVEIVGVVRDMRYANVRDTLPPTTYSAFAQRPSGNASFAVRTRQPLAALGESIRKVVREVDPHIPVTDLRTQDQQMERLFRQERMFASLTSSFGALALLLTCVGLYGLMAYAVQRRTGEIGLRMALGAQPGQVLRQVLREALGLVATGVV